MNTAVRQPTFEIKMNIRSSRVYSAPVPKMPPGLVELMEGLARDVLKNNPTEVYEFCAEHMQKLLQIRDGPTTKNTLTLKQKIAKATTKIRDRAAQRRDEFDKKNQLIQRVQSDQNYNDEIMKKYDNEAEQYIHENVVKISQNHLTGNIEHELIAGAIQVANTKNITPSDTKPEDDIDLRNESHKVNLFTSEHDNITKIEEESSEFKLNEITDDKRVEINDELILSKEDQNEQNVLKENINFKEEQTDSNASNPKIIEDSDITIVDENNDKKNHINILKDNTQSTDCEETTNAINGVDNSSAAIEIDEHKDINGYDYNITNNPNNIKNYHKEEENNYQVDTIVDTIEETTQDDQTSSIDNNVTSSDINVKEKNDKQKSDEITESVNNTDVKTFDEPAENELKNKYGESYGHVNNNSMDLETAAITIQKVFRSFLFRNKTSSIDDSTNIYMNLLIEDKEKKDDEAMSINNIKDRRCLGISRMDTVLQTVNEEKSLSLSTDDSSTLSSAATIIQAHVMIKVKGENN
ncbi:5'-AMP-activated serine/threonine-protein kinase catalytic subunit alpha-like [Nymphalis io]|uniref:5'-AMP-activated serine/threonine-protein kinase catalytic subunit alpha-like n=1 Tax=Inachis io TaxID=171585 RepID=UPI002169204A|nr:5'-AMP-activated serine/threonine-protein kinase catalytic subunit alpha-like [Nymphalis io]